MNKTFTLGSLFDGSGGFPLGAVLNGITPVWASEIEPFPIRVTTKRFPGMKHLGDISKLNGAELEPVDIITFGSPCTDLSVAGKRAGLDGKQSSLFHEAIRIIREMRCKTNGQYPRYIVWENVPGAFSSCKGEDFRCVLEEITQTANEAYTVPLPEKRKWMHSGQIMGDGFSIAWRTFNAQFWGVPQRRRRIYLIADFGGVTAPQILFESEGVFGYLEKSRKPWKGTACNAERSTASAISFEPGAMSRLGGYTNKNLSGTLRAAMGDNQTCVAIENHPQDSRVKISEDGKIQTLTKSIGGGGGNVPLVLNERQQALTVGEDVANTLTGTDFKGTQCVFEASPKTMKIRCGCEGGGKGALIQDDKSATLSCNNDQTLFEPTVYGICSDGSNAMKSDNPHSGVYKADTSKTIDANGGNPGCNQGGMAVVSLQGSMIGLKDKNGPHGSGINTDVSFTLNTADKHAVVYALDRAAYNQGKNAQFDISIDDNGTAQTVVAKGPGAVASFYPQMKSESQCYRDDGKSNTLVNGTNPGFQNGIVSPGYTVRRLTPLESCRLQGFPDWWCMGLETENPTDDDITFWTEIFETHRKITDPYKKPKSEKQIIKWLKNPYSDSAEYKMWGNGVALPCVCYVMCGIVHWYKNVQ